VGVVLTGLQGDLVEVEADLSNQTPNFTIIGLVDKAIGEAHQRAQRVRQRRSATST
jgi:magnesium chelatase family protein